MEKNKRKVSLDGRRNENLHRRVPKVAVRVVAWLAGSWWGVILHAAWFAIWLTYNFNLNLLTLAVSLEAIFLGIFLLMASNQAEMERDRREAAAQHRSQEIVDRILDIGYKISKQQQQTLKLLSEMQEQIDGKKKTL